MDARLALVPVISPYRADRDRARDILTRLRDQGIGVTVVDPRWVKPVDPALVGAAPDVPPAPESVKLALVVFQ